MRRRLAETGPLPADQKALVAHLYGSSLEIKGAGGTIGYDLLTLIGRASTISSPACRGWTSGR